MRRQVIFALLIVVGLTATVGTAAGQNADACEFPYEAPNGEVIQEEPDAIAPGIASVSQTLWEMGVNENADKDIVGLTSNSFYLEGSEGYDDLGTTLSSGYEENVIAKDPDVVVNGLYDPMGLESSLDGAGIDYVFVSQSGGFEEIKKNVRVIGRSIGECDAAERVVNEMEDRINRVENAVRGREEPVVMYGTPTRDPGQYDNFVPGNGTFKHDIITTAGGDNVYDRIGVEGGGPDGSQEVRISGEKAVLAVNEDPDWIVVTEGATVPRNALYNSTTAVRENQILRVNPNYINQDAPRITTPLERMARAFHPEAFDDDSGSSGGGGSAPSDESSGALRASVSVGDGTARATFDEGPVETVEIDAEAEGDAVVEPVDVSGAPGTPVSRFSVTVPEGAHGVGGTLRLRVKDTSLENSGVASDDLVVMRRGDGWETVDAEFLDTETGVTVVFETPVFSEFAVVASTAPVARAEASVEEGSVVLSASGSSDEYGEIVGYEWTVDGETYEGETVEVETDAEEATLTVTNDAGLTDQTTVEPPAAGDNTTVEDDEEGRREQQSSNSSGNGTGTDAADEDGDGSPLPGFGVIVAVVAVVAAAVLRR